MPEKTLLKNRVAIKNLFVIMANILRFRRNMITRYKVQKKTQAVDNLLRKII